MIEILVQVSAGASFGLALPSLMVIALVAALPPLMVDLLNLQVAEMVVLLAAGALFSPHGLQWIRVDDAVTLLSEPGLGFLCFMAGLELKPAAMVGQSGRLACAGWAARVLLALLVASSLHLFNCRCCSSAAALGGTRRPQLLTYHRAIADPRDRCRFSLLMSTTLPIIVIVTTVETRAGLMQFANTAALVGVGVLSVLLFPWLAGLLARPQES